MEARILLMYAVPYDIQEEGRDNISGCSVHYFFFGKEGEELSFQHNTEGSAIGYQRAKASIDFDKFSKIDCVPGIYDASFDMKVGGDGKPVLKIADVDFVCQADFTLIGKEIENTIKNNEKARKEMQKKAVEATEL